MAPITQNPVEKFLHDAERAARNGDRKLAMELIVLALDTAPWDPSVLMRAYAVRNMLPQVQDPSPDSQMFIEEDELGEQTEQPTQTLDEDQETAPLDEEKEPGTLFELPEVGALAGEQEQEPQETASWEQEEDDTEAPQMTFPDDMEEEGASEQEFDPFGGDERSELDELLAEVEGAENSQGGMGRRQTGTPRGRQHHSSSSDLPKEARPKTTSKALWVLWPLLILVSLGAGLVLFQPQMAQEIEQEVRALFYPMDKAKDALQDGDYETALSAARQALSANTQPGYAHFLAGRALVGLEQREQALTELKRATQRAEEWSTIMSAARVMQEAQFYEEAAQAYIRAFEQGANLTQMPEIIKAQLQARDFDAARRMISIYERGTDKTFDVQAYLDSLNIQRETSSQVPSGNGSPPEGG